MKTKNFILLFFFVSLISSSPSNAQETYSETNKFSVGLNFGSLLPYGDIKQWDYKPVDDELKWGWGAVVNYQISTYFSLQGQFLTGKLAGSKKNFTSNTGPYHEGLEANLKFNAEFWEISMNATVSLNRLLTPCLKLNNRWNIYGIGGVGYFNFRSQLRGLLDDRYINSYGWTSDGTVKDKMTREAVVPAGLGVKYKISNKFDVYAESTMRFVFTDKMDAYVRVYNFNDKYGYTSLGLIYRFGNKDKKHMEWVLPVCDTQPFDMTDITDMQKKLKDMEDQLKKIQAECCVPRKEGKDFSDDIDDMKGKIKFLDTEIKRLSKEVDRVDNKVIISPKDIQPGVDLGELININPIYFDFNKHDIRPDAAVELDKIVEIMNRFPNMEIELGSHTDCRGSDDYNFELSSKRAYSSAEYIKSRITMPNRIYGRGYGESKPKVKCICDERGQSDCTEEQHQLNRRTEFIIIKK
jgi:outer membrane protein OmpA-like peptidoglycan-associated protein